MAITKHLQEMINNLPVDKEEFTTDDISPARVYRIDWVLRRCVEEGVLSVRYEWKDSKNMYASLNYYYKFINNGN